MILKNKAKLAFSVLSYKFSRHKRHPVVVAWLITGRCNASCLYCKWKHLRASDELNTNEVKNMVDQMKQAGVLFISFTGGEPLLREDMGEIIRYVKDSGLVCKLNTNGSLVKSRIDDLRGLDLLQISFDGPGELHDKLRGNGTSGVASEAVRAAKKAGIKVQLITCLTKKNISALDQVLAYGVNVGSKFNFQILSKEFMGKSEIDTCLPGKEELVNALQYLIDLKRNRDSLSKAIGNSRSELEYYLNQTEGGDGRCDCELVTATMLPEGKLIFCGNSREYKYFDARSEGFQSAFSKLTIPECDGCVCVGKLRLSRVYKWDISVIGDMIRK